MDFISPNGQLSIDKEIIMQLLTSIADSDKVFVLALVVLVGYGLYKSLSLCSKTYLECKKSSANNSSESPQGKNI